MKRKRANTHATPRSRRREGVQLLIDRPQFARLSDWLSRGVPEPLRRWVVGPTNTVTVDGSGHVVDRPFRRVRPTRIIISPTLVLRRRVEISEQRRRDARDIVDLIIRSETPFAPRDVFARLVRLPDGGTDRPRHDLLLVPREPVERVLKELGIRFQGLVGIFVSDGSRQVRIGLARRPLERVAGAAWAMPVVIVAGTFSYLSAGELAVRQALLSELEAITTEEAAKLRELLAKRDALEAEASKFDVARMALISATPAGWLLAKLRTAMPEQVEVVRIELRDGSLRLQVRGQDALGIARTIDQALPEWSATIDGTITADPRGGEAATILIAQRDQSS